MPTDEETVEFMTYQFPKEVTDDSEIFTHIARMSDAILQRVDPTNLVLMEYLETINPDDGSGKLLPKEIVGPSKKLHKSKKDATITPEKPVQEPKKKKSPPKQTKLDTQVLIVVVEPVEHVTDEQAKEKIPSKSGIFRRIKKKYRRSLKLSDGSFKSSSMVRKPYLNHQGILIREVPAPISPSSKKWRAEDVAKHTYKKKLKKRKLVP